MRKYMIFIISLILLSGSITANFAAQDLRDYMLRGYVDATRTTDLPYRIPRFGVNADLLQYTPERLEQHLQWMQEANVNWVRQFIYWDEIEPVQGDYQWDELDIVMSALENHPDMQMIPVFMNSPAWARSSDIATAPPDDPTAIIPFLQAFAERYGHDITYYQVWDEPNLDDAWGLSDPRPAEYVALLAESYRAIHSSDIDAVVIAAALAPTTESGGHNIAEHLYLQQMYDLGASDYFDAVAGKPYGFDFAPDDREVLASKLNFSRLILLREIMVNNSDGDKALWASHWGWNSLPPEWEGDPSIWGAVTEQSRLDYTINAMERAEREWPWLGGMILHHWQPAVDDSDPQWGFSVINPHDEPSSLWQALADRIPQQAASNGLYHPRIEYASYSGLWTFGERGADIGWLETSDSQLDFTFAGTDIALLLREGDYIAFLYPTVDEQQANVTPHDADGNAYILLRSGSQSPELNAVPVSRNLDYGIHNLHVVADRGEDQWALAGYAVSDGNLATPYIRQVQISWLAILTSLVATIVSAYFLDWRAIFKQLHLLTDAVYQGTQLVITIATSLAMMLGLLLSIGLPDQALFRRELAEQTALIIVTGGLLILELPLLVALVALVILFWLVYKHIEWGLLLTVLYAPFFLFPVELYTFFFPMSELLILITSAAWLLRLFVQYGEERQSANIDYTLRLRIQWHPLDGLMLIWVILGCLAVTWSANTGTALTELRTLFIEPFLFYCIFRTIKPDFAIVRRFVYVLVTAGVLVSVIGIFLYFSGQGVITAEGGARRLASVYGSPNNVGLLLGRVMPFVFAFVLLVKDRLRYVAGCILILLLVTVALTQSVGAILIGIPAGVTAVLVAIYRRRSIPVLIVLAILGLVATFGLTQVSARFASLLDLSSGTNFIRLRVWESTLDILSDYPITGLGLDQFLPVFSGAYIRPDAIADPDLSHPHNILLDFWIRLGIFGVLWLGTFLIVFWRSAITALQASDNHPDYYLLIGAIGAMTALIAHGMIDNSIYVNDLVYIFVLLIGIVVIFSNQRVESDALNTV